VGFGHDCSFAEIPALLSGYDLAPWIFQNQRQAPVAAETQRRVARLRISPVTGAIFDLMRQLSVEQFPTLTIQWSIESVNKMTIQFSRPGTSGLLCAGRKAN
jgi:hypothetical protein